MKTLVCDYVFVCLKKILYTANNTLDKNPRYPPSSIKETKFPYFFWKMIIPTMFTFISVYVLWNFLTYFRWAYTHSVFSLWAWLLDCLMICPSALMHRCELMKNTGNPFRSSDLGVMSPARCPCAMPVLNDWVAAFIASSLTIPAIGFDPMSQRGFHRELPLLRTGKTNILEWNDDATAFIAWQFL